MPAFVNKRFGDVGIREAEGTMLCCLPAKNSKKLFLISAEVISFKCVRRLPARSFFLVWIKIRAESFCRREETD